MSAPKTPSFFGRLKARLSSGSAALGSSLRALVSGRKVDAALLDELETRLLAADAGVEATAALLDELQRGVARRELTDDRALLDALRQQIQSLLAPCEKVMAIDTAAKPFCVLVVGVNGSGKTTSIGKLTQRLRQQGHSVTLAAGDTFRAAAVEQLKIWAERAGAEFVGQSTGTDPGAVIFDATRVAAARGSTVLIADTAGRLHNQSHLMEELKKIKRVLQRAHVGAPHEVLLVLDANQGQNALAQAEQFHAALDLTGLIVTKLDGTAKGGIVLAIARKLRLPIYFIGVGEQLEDFAPFNARAFAAALVGDDDLEVDTPRRAEVGA